MSLTDAQCRKAKPSGKQILKLADGAALALWVRPTGSKSWVYSFRLDGKQKTYTIGTYPEVGLADARRALVEAKSLVKQGHDPTLAKKAKKYAVTKAQKNTFRSVSEEWLKKKSVKWAETTTKQCRTIFEQDVWPKLGGFPIETITTFHLSQLINKVEGRGAESVAILITQWVCGVYKHAARSGLTDINPAYALQGSVAKPKTVHKTPLNEEQLKLLGEKLSSYRGRPETVAAIKLMCHTFLRTKELRLAEWTEIDFENSRWDVPGERMKKKERHIVPISNQVFALLKALKAINGGGKFLFPSTKGKGKCMSSTTINRALEYMGFSSSEVSKERLKIDSEKEVLNGDSFSGHSFRATASTILNEKRFRYDVVELQLAHKERNKTRGSYNHAEYLVERADMMQFWSDYLGGIHKGLVAP